MDHLFPRLSLAVVDKTAGDHHSPNNERILDQASGTSTISPATIPTKPTRPVMPAMALKAWLAVMPETVAEPIIPNQDRRLKGIAIRVRTPSRSHMVGLRISARQT